MASAELCLLPGWVPNPASSEAWGPNPMPAVRSSELI